MAGKRILIVDDEGFLLNLLNVYWKVLDMIFMRHMMVYQDYLKPVRSNQI